MNTSFLPQLGAPARPPFIPALAAVALCFVTYAALAEESGDREKADRSILESSSPGSARAATEVPLEPVIIEGDGPNAEPTLDQLQRKLGDALARQPGSGLNERRLNDGVLEVTTRFGRFCTRPMPSYLSSGVGGDIGLLAPCAAF